MSNEQPTSRPPKRSGSGASPMGSTLAIVIAIAAVVVGFLILKNIRSDDDDATSHHRGFHDDRRPAHHDNAATGPHRNPAERLHPDDCRSEGLGCQLFARQRRRRDADDCTGGQSVPDGRGHQRCDQGSGHQDPVPPWRRRGAGCCTVGRGADGRRDDRADADASPVAGSDVARPTTPCWFCWATTRPARPWRRWSSPLLQTQRQRARQPLREPRKPKKERGCGSLDAPQRFVHRPFGAVQSSTRLT